MELNRGATVSNAAGEKVGHVDRVVMDPRTKEVSHIVVHRGLISAKDKVVPVSLIESASAEGVVLREGANGLESLPNFEDRHYIPVHETELRNRRRGDDSANPVYWYPPSLGSPVPLFNPTPEPEYVVKTERNVPEGTVALKEGARVVSADDRHVGNVEKVLTDPRSDRATHLMISKGLLLKARKLIPTTWIKDVAEEEVRLAVGSATLEELGEYAEPD